MTDGKQTVQALASLIHHRSENDVKPANPVPQLSPEQRFSAVLATLRGTPDALAELRTARQSLDVVSLRVQQQWLPVLDRAIAHITPVDTPRREPVPVARPVFQTDHSEKPEQRPSGNDVLDTRQNGDNDDFSKQSRRGSSSSDVNRDPRSSEPLPAEPGAARVNEEDDNAANYVVPQFQGKGSRDDGSDPSRRQDAIVEETRTATLAQDRLRHEVLNIEAGQARQVFATQQQSPSGVTTPAVINPQQGLVREVQGLPQNPLQAPVSTLVNHDVTVTPIVSDEALKSIRAQDLIQAASSGGDKKPSVNPAPVVTTQITTTTQAPVALGIASPAPPVSDIVNQPAPAGQTLTANTDKTVPSGAGFLAADNLAAEVRPGASLLLARYIDRTFGDGTASSSQLQVDIKAGDNSLKPTPTVHALLSGNTIKAIIDVRTDPATPLAGDGQPPGTKGPSEQGAQPGQPQARTTPHVPVTLQDGARPEIKPDAAVASNPRASISVANQQSQAVANPAAAIVSAHVVPTQVAISPGIAVPGQSGVVVLPGNGVSQPGSGAGQQGGSNPGSQGQSGGDTNTNRQPRLGDTTNRIGRNPRISQGSGEPRTTSTFASVLESVPGNVRRDGVATALPRAPVTPQQLHRVVTSGANQAKTGGDQFIKVHLSPGKLGNVQIQFEFTKENQVKVLIVVENREALDLVGRERTQIVQSLKDSGYDCDSSCLEFSMQDSNANHNQAQNRESLGKSTDQNTRENSLPKDEDVNPVPHSQPADGPGINVIV